MLQQFDEIVRPCRLARIQIKFLGKLVEDLRIPSEKMQVKEILGTLKFVLLQVRIYSGVRRPKIWYARTHTYPCPR